MIDVALVGTGGMMPLPGRFLSSMLCRINGSMILFDCGEGTQVSLRMLGWGFKNIDIICFTHYHGDHISGLPGLLLTIANSEREEPLTLIGPPGLKEVVTSLCIIARDLPFEINFTEWDRAGNTYHDGMIIIKSLPLRHRCPCFGYTVELLRRGKFDQERAKALDIPVKYWGILQKQIEDFIVYNNRIYTPDMVLGPPRKGLKIAYATDTRPVKALPDFVRNADLFICEGLYGAADKQKKAADHMHMTFSEAAKIARDGEVGELWLTHFSPALPDPYNYLHTATETFPNTKINKDRATKTLRFEDGD